MIKERFATLSKREKEVLAGLLNGKSNKSYRAMNLVISMRTVEVHRANIDEKDPSDQLGGARDNGARRRGWRGVKTLCRKKRQAPSRTWRGRLDIDRAA